MHETKGAVAPQELETFLPADGRKEQIVPAQQKIVKDKDAEAGTPLSDGYDPFAERKLDHPTSNSDTLMHLLKASLGTGILAMPRAFACTGLLTGILFTALVALVCTHCAYILIDCAHILYRRTRTPSMTFAEVAEAALATGPSWARPYASSFKMFVTTCLFATYFGTCSVYTVLAAKNIHEVVAHYMGVENNELEIRIFIAGLLIPIIMMVWVRDLKRLAPVSMVANGLMALGLGITLYYLLFTGESGSWSQRNLVNWPPTRWPMFFSLTIFAIEAIGVIMPLENAMSTPRALLGFFGVLNKGAAAVAIVYAILGALGYLRYGEAAQDSVTLDLHIAEIPAQVVRIAIALAVYCTFGLQFYVCLEIALRWLPESGWGRTLLAEYALRTALATVCVLLAVAVPTIGPFMGVIGALCFSLLGLVAPAVIELITYWEEGYGRANRLLWKNVLVLTFGLLALVFGTKDAVLEIISQYSSKTTR